MESATPQRLQLAHQLISIVMLALTVTVGPQMLGAWQTQEEPQEQKPLIDGSLHPTMISDDTAIRIFYLSLAESNNGVASTPTQIHLKLSGSGLTTADETIIRSHLSEVYTADLVPYHMAQAETGRRIQKHGFASDGDVYIQAHNALGNALCLRFANLRASLGRDGALRLDAYLKAIKSRIVVYRTPMGGN